ncbi:MAG TPA: hypothetical protein VFQ89_03365, partial [Candidatus Binatia bacterium]|nr:hypothetical protein [Candidatus Binatia bacterium]
CATLWRAQLGLSRDIAEVQRYQEELGKALPTLAAAARAEATPNRIDGLKAAFRGGTPSPLEKARVAFRAGDIESARSLAQSALDQTQRANSSWTQILTALVAVLLLALTGGAALAWRARRRSRAAQRADDRHLLTSLLAQPPSKAKQAPPRKIKRVA